MRERCKNGCDMSETRVYDTSGKSYCGKCKKKYKTDRREHYTELERERYRRKAAA